MNVFDLQAILTLDSKQYDSELDNSEKKASSWGSSIKKGFLAAGAAFAATGAAIVKGVNDVSKYGDEIDKMSQKLGISTEAYQKWDYVLQISGTDMKSTAMGLKTLTNKLDDAKNGSSSAIEAFERIGLSLEDIQDMSQEEIFEATVRSLANMEEGADRAAVANDLLGKSGMQLAPLFNLTNEEIDELMQNTEDLGMIMSEDAVKASANYQDALTTLKGTLGGVKNSLLSELLPAFTNVINGGVELAGNLKNAFQDGGLLGALSFLGETITSSLADKFSAAKDAIVEKFPEMEGVFTSLGDLWETLKTVTSTALESIRTIVTTVLDKLRAFWDKWGTTIKTYVSAVFTNIKIAIETAMNVIKGIIEVVTGIISGDWKKVFGGLKNIVTSIFTGIKNTISNVLNAVWSIAGNIVSRIYSAIASKFQAVWDKVKSIFGGIRDTIKNTIQSAYDKVKVVVDKIKNFFNFKWELPKIKLPHFSVQGSANPINWLTQGVPKIKIDWWKKAYNSAYEFTNPTIIPAMGLGEGVGSELLIGKAKLYEDIGNVVDDRLGNLATAIASVLAYMQEYFPQFANRPIVLDDGTLVSRIAPQMDEALGYIQSRKVRG